MERISATLAHLSKATGIGTGGADAVTERIPSHFRNELYESSEFGEWMVQWFQQKSDLGQDMFFVSTGGPNARHLAMHIAATLGREVEYVALTRDTSESDLKQRREISGGRSLFRDQAVVDAALHGRILILEGMEKAERNVLPILNNLLENREMALEDGRFLTAASRYDQLDADAIASSNLIRVSEDFRVIAIGLPVPPFPGNPLDPPLRSRFQAVLIENVPSRSLYRVARSLYAPSQWSQSGVIALLAYYQVFNVGQQKQARGSDSQDDRIGIISKTQLLLRHVPHYGAVPLTLFYSLDLFPGLSVAFVASISHPWSLATLNVEAKELARNASLPLVELDSEEERGVYLIDATASSPPTRPPLCTETFHGRTAGVTGQEVALVFSREGTADVRVVAHGGRAAKQLPGEMLHFVMQYHRRVLSGMLQSHAVGRDICLVGEKGEGKTTLVASFAQVLGYSLAENGDGVETLFLYKDMSARDLIQRRGTTEKGETVWVATALIRALDAGSLCVLDGIDRLPYGTLSVIARLIEDRELVLFDGTHYLHHDKFDGLSAALQESSSVRRIHPSFRIVATATPPSLTSPWLSHEVSHYFHFHVLDVLGSSRSASDAELADFLQFLVPESDSQIVTRLAALSLRLRELHSDPLRRLARPPSVRQLLRLLRHQAQFPDDLVSQLRSTLMIPFLPATKQAMLFALLEELGLATEVEMRRVSSRQPGKVVMDGEGVGDGVAYRLSLGAISLTVRHPSSPELVPDLVFYDIDKHVILLEDMLKSFLQGEHLLLIGNQGVGKNKLADRLLQLLLVQREREYIQLHRDTTVQSLTLSPSLQDGVIVWEDSPFVRALETGRVLMIDEVDKAPVEVVCVLKALLEDGELVLGNGVRYVVTRAGEDRPEAPGVRYVHPDFRVIALANRPGYPFLGNDFFVEMGDIFSAFAIENPDLASEVQLLRGYAPTLPESVLVKLSTAFQELRQMIDDGILLYPFSTRELVNVVRHLEAYPEENIGHVLRNVFAFDTLDFELHDTLAEVFNRHGIPFHSAGPRRLAQKVAVSKDGRSSRGDSGAGSSVTTGERRPFPPLEVTGPMWLTTSSSVALPSFASVQWCGHELCFAPAPGGPASSPIALRDARCFDFGREMSSWRVAEGLCGMCDIGGDGGLLLSVSSDCNVVLHHLDVEEGSAHLLAGPLRLPHFSTEHAVIMRPVGATDVLVLQLARGELNVAVVRVKEEGEGGASVTVATTKVVCPLTWKSVDSRQLRMAMSVGGMCAVWARGYPGAVLLSSPPSSPSSLSTGLILANAESSKLHLQDMSWTHGDRLLVQCEEDLLLDVLLHAGTQTPVAHISLKQVLDGPPTDRVTRAIASEPLPGDVAPELMAITVSRNGTLAEERAVLEPQRKRTIRHMHVTGGTEKTYFALLVGIPSSVENYEAETVTNNSSDVRLCVAAVAPRREDNNDDDEVPPVRVISQWLPESSLLAMAEEDFLSAVRLRVIDLATGTMVRIPVPAHQELPVAIVELGAGRVLLPFSNGVSHVYELSDSRLARQREEWEETAMAEAPTVEKGEEGEREEAGVAGGIGNGESESGSGSGGGKGKGGGGGGGGSLLQDDEFNKVRSEGGGAGDASVFHQMLARTGLKMEDEETALLIRQTLAEAETATEKVLDPAKHTVDLTDAMYERVRHIVAKEITQLRIILDAVEARERERSWLKMQTQGDLDDSRLVDGVAGERTIYKRRGVEAPVFGSLQKHPKRLMFVIDCSSSMSRFNGSDRRMDRAIACTLLIMEAFHGFEYKYDYAIVAHDGESPLIPLVRFGKPPVTKEEKRSVLNRMFWNSVNCSSGDNTLSALLLAMKTVTDVPGDDYFVFLLSDANLERYGITGEILSALLMSDERVKAFAIFVSQESLGDLASRMPPGRGVVCMDTAQLPAIFKQLFMQEVLDGTRSSL